MKRPSYQISLPAEVRFDRSLTANIKLLYGEIKALCDQQGYCWASNYYFAQLYGVKKKTISSWLNQLKKHQLILIKPHQKQGNQRQIYLLERPAQGSMKSEEGEGQNGRGLPNSSPPYSEFIASNRPSHLINNFIDNNDRVYKDPIPISSTDEKKEKRANASPVSASENGPTPPGKKATGNTSPSSQPDNAFVKPTLTQVEAYMRQQKEPCPDAATIKSQAQRFINYYQSNGWKVGRNAMQDWQAAVNNWLLNAQAYAQEANRAAQNDIMSPNFDQYAPRLHSGGKKDYSIPL
jgi:hypothetical protein